jgi:uncharacterized surface protein with fasciclin (FAS1) repeats
MSDLSILSELLVLAGLDESILNAFVLTLAALTNSAFEVLGDATLNSLRLPTNRGTLRQTLLYHAIVDVLTVDRLAQQTNFVTLAGINVETSVVDEPSN